VRAVWRKDFFDRLDRAYDQHVEGKDWRPGSATQPNQQMIAPFPALSALQTAHLATQAGSVEWLDCRS
jgi:hypothetical protein